MKASALKQLLLAVALLALSMSALTSVIAQNKTTSRETPAYRTIEWDELVPKDWDPMREFKGTDFSRFKDGDPRAMEALQKLREAWDSAPVEASLRGTRVRIAGFMVPLEQSRAGVREFLLVPYFGACIHSPPPPANQIIHVTSAVPLKGLTWMSTVWVSGILDTGHAASQWGASGYKLKAELVTAYVEQAKGR